MQEDQTALGWLGRGDHGIHGTIQYTITEVCLAMAMKAMATAISSAKMSTEMKNAMGNRSAKVREGRADPVRSILFSSGIVC